MKQSCIMRQCIAVSGLACSKESSYIFKSIHTHIFYKNINFAVYQMHNKVQYYSFSSEKENNRIIEFNQY